MSLGNTLGTPIQMDHFPSNQDYGYHANVLVDIDLSQPIPDHILLEIEENIIKQELLLHKVSKYCNHYKNVGYTIAECKIVQKAYRVNEMEHNKVNKKTGKELAKGIRGNQTEPLEVNSTTSSPIYAPEDIEHANLASHEENDGDHNNSSQQGESKVADIEPTPTSINVEEILEGDEYSKAVQEV
ncbi:hypothetical protein GIB67_023225 [Kingdonia uniflora]|uniref:Uncharacterized protein n=1 Tax=Kingdonia uniflora TaxID=39325 RepID=A0A7J7L9B3_9MAGN|nr:hypothetical protein GIB67_023225 [Kingdonia uniflora]